MHVVPNGISKTPISYRWIMVYAINSTLGGLRMQNIAITAPVETPYWSYVEFGIEQVARLTGTDTEQIALVSMIGPFSLSSAEQSPAPHLIN